MSRVLECPFCNLRFSTRSEFEQHQALDHSWKDEGASENATQDALDPRVVQEESADQIEQPAPRGGFFTRLFKRG